MTRANLSDLAIAPLLPDIGATLASSTRLVLEAPPGAGKTTGVPLSLLDAPWLERRSILVLEPRRIAARAAAARMASLLGEPLGKTVGYRTRLDSRVGPDTRIEVVTEGILTRRIQGDPELAGVGLVIFDEFHERNLAADLGLALTLDTAKALRPDLRLMVMSATLDGGAVARVLDGAPVLRAEGRTFPIETRHLAAPPPGKLIPGVVAAVRHALAESDGDMLVFLPGEREIRTAERMLNNEAPDALVVPLYGALPPEAQDRVFAAAPRGQRKIVLSTSIAETSLTIDGIRVVVDSGFAREPRFDPATGMTRLETVRVSQASADQRRGRAGRTAPGVGFRLWPEAATKGLAPRATPEILQADLAPLALELAQWGSTDPSALAWLDPPPTAAYGEALALLRELGALDAGDRLTAHGRAMARLPLHPRLAHMVIRARDLDLVYEASLVAALLTERDILAGPAASRDADLRLRIDVLHRAIPLPAGMSMRDSGRHRALAAARQIRGLIKSEDPKRPPRSESLGVLVALAYPDRIAQARGGGYRLANGRGAALPDGDPLGHEPWLAVAEVGGGDKDGRIFLAAPLTRAEIDEHFADEIAAVDTVAWNPRTETVDARRQRRLGALILDDGHWSDAPPDRVAAALLDGVRSLGLDALPWTDTVRQLRARVAFMASVDGTDSGWPVLSDEALLASLDDWLLPYLVGKRSRRDLGSLDLAAILGERLIWDQRRRLDSEAPRTIRLPSGREVTLDYGTGEAPVLAAKLQDFFGWADAPRIGGGRISLTLHLLSPAGRPVQVTRDLAGFWKGSYAEVRKDMRGRYPKHRWPDDPTTAEPNVPGRPRR